MSPGFCGVFFLCNFQVFLVNGLLSPRSHLRPVALGISFSQLLKDYAFGWRLRVSPVFMLSHLSIGGEGPGTELTFASITELAR